MICVWKLEDDNHYMVEGIKLSHRRNLLLSGGYLYCISRRILTNLLKCLEVNQKDINYITKTNAKHYPELRVERPKESK